MDVYLRDIESGKPMPIKKLVAFKRISVPSGQSLRVELEIEVKDFAYYDEDREAFVIEPGDFEIQAGPSSSDIRLKGVVSVG